MNLFTITTKNRKSKKYNITVDLVALERIAGSLGLFQKKFLSEMKKSVADMKAGRVIKGRGLKYL